MCIRDRIDRRGRPCAATMFGGRSSSSFTRDVFSRALEGPGRRGSRALRFAVAAEVPRFAREVSRGGLVVDRLAFTPVGSGTEVLREVNLRIPPTDLNLIVGRSGFGKSTLLHLITGLSEPTGGCITFTDQPDFGHMSSAERLARVGRSFSSPRGTFWAGTCSPS